MNYILIGFMGSGKTAVSRILADKLGYKTIDTDEYIEQKEGRTIKQIFAEDGEEYFRQLETEALTTLNDRNENTMIIASGGGLPMREINRQELHKLGTIVYLRAKETTLEKRLSGDKKRPLLKGASLKDKIHGLLNKRSDTYTELADIIVDTDDKNVFQIADEIIMKGKMK